MPSDVCYITGTNSNTISMGAATAITPLSYQSVSIVSLPDRIETNMEWLDRRIREMIDCWKRHD